MLHEVLLLTRDVNEVFHSGQKSHELVLALFGVVVLPPRLTAATVQRHRPFPLRALLKAASSVGGAKPNVVVVDWLHSETSL